MHATRQGQGQATGMPMPVGIAAFLATDVMGILVLLTLRRCLGLAIAIRRPGADPPGAAFLATEARTSRPPLFPRGDRLSAAFVPAVLVAAAATLAYWTLAVGAGAGVMNALCVLLIACPGAIGLAMPLASTVAAGRAAAAGVLVRSGEVFARLARSQRMLFDKTGTLTAGTPELRDVVPAPGVGPDELLQVAASVEAGSEHPLARAVVVAAEARGLPLRAVRGFRAVPGRGVEAWLEPDGERVLAGSPDFADDVSAFDTPAAGVPAAPGASVISVRRGERLLGRLVLRDALRPSALPALDALSNEDLVLEVLSGDRPEAVEAFASGMPSVLARGGLLPEQKRARFAASIQAGETPVMVGDGIDDAPRLRGASVGVTFEAGTDPTPVDVADVTILGGDLGLLPWLVRLSRATLRTARLNLAWAFVYNVVGIGLAMAGVLRPLLAALAMLLSSLLVVLHSQRLSRIAPPEAHA